MCLLALGVSGCAKLKARDLLNKGVAAFKNGQSDAAIEDFKQAKEADPDLLNARLYLATASVTRIGWRIDGPVLQRYNETVAPAPVS